MTTKNIGRRGAAWTMKICEKCGRLRSEILKVCGGCLDAERGEKPRAPMPLSPTEQAAAEAFLGKINQVVKPRRC